MDASTDSTTWCHLRDAPVSGVVPDAPLLLLGMSLLLPWLLLLWSLLLGLPLLPLPMRMLLLWHPTLAANRGGEEQCI